MTGSPGSTKRMRASGPESGAVTSEDHYAGLLAQHYTWMFGASFECKVKEQAALLREAGVGAPGTAVDLGSGSGFQTSALIALGAERVHAVDLCEDLLKELEQRVPNHRVTAHRADLMAFDHLVDSAVDTIVCMGDTLTHLASHADVGALFGKIADRLRPGGRLVVSWRDLSQLPGGVNRFIPVRGDDDRIMVCFLEDREETVLVHDIVHVKEGTRWTMQVSAYAKLKLSERRVRAALVKAGLDPYFIKSTGGMTVLAAALQSSISR